MKALLYAQNAASFPDLSPTAYRRLRSLLLAAQDAHEAACAGQISFDSPAFELLANALAGVCHRGMDLDLDHLHRRSVGEARPALDIGEVRESIFYLVDGLVAR